MKVKNKITGVEWEITDEEHLKRLRKDPDYTIHAATAEKKDAKEKKGAGKEAKPGKDTKPDGKDGEADNPEKEDGADVK